MRLLLTLTASCIASTSAGCPLLEEGGRKLREPCQDVLAATPSPIKDCEVLVLSAPCGSVSFGTEVNAVCAKTCGICQDENDGAGGTGVPATSQPTKQPNVVDPDAFFLVRLNPEIGEGGEYTDFNVTAHYVEITTRIPESTDWFGYHFFSFQSTPGDEQYVFL